MTRTGGGADGFTAPVLDMLEDETTIATRQHQLHAIPHLEAVLDVDLENAAVGVVADHLADKLLVHPHRVATLIVLVLVVDMTAIEALRVAAVGEVVEFIHQTHVEGTARHGVIDGPTIDLGGARNIVVGLGAPLDLQRGDAHLGEPRHVLHGTQILGVHDIGAVLILEDRHQLTGACGILDQGRELILPLYPTGRGRAVARAATARCDQPALAAPLARCPDTAGGMGRGRVGRHQVAGLVVGRRHGVVLPAAGVGAGTLVGVAVIEIAREQAASGVGDAQGTVHEGLDLEIGALGTDLGDLLERQLARENDSADPLLLPEAGRRPVDHVGLHREVNLLLGPALANHHDQPRVGHDQRIRPGLDHRLHIAQIGLQLAVMRRNIRGHVELLAPLMRIGDALVQVIELEIVVAHAQRVARLAGIDRIRAIGEGVTHVLEGARGGQQFRGLHGDHRCQDDGILDGAWPQGCKGMKGAKV